MRPSRQTRFAQHHLAGGTVPGQQLITGKIVGRDIWPNCNCKTDSNASTKHFCLGRSHQFQMEMVAAKLMMLYRVLVMGALPSHISLHKRQQNTATVTLPDDGMGNHRRVSAFHISALGCVCPRLDSMSVNRYHKSHIVSRYQLRTKLLLAVLNRNRTVASITCPVDCYRIRNGPNIVE